MTCALVVPAAGRGERLGAGLPKALVAAAGEPLLVHALRRALDSGVVDVVVVVAPEGEQQRVHVLLAPLGLPDLRVVIGGAERQDSVRRGLAALPEDVDVVLVHDAARCLTPPSVFRSVVEAVRAGGVAVVPVLPVSDTVKRVAAGRVLETVDRRELVAVQTPQGFAPGPLRRAHEAATGAAPATDDAGMLEALGHEVLTVVGDDAAFKITRPVDLVLAEALLRGGGA
ncbi:2-C-methyl-D-erythritol 4-phosphate cytidylyltransferase [Kineococcus sp. TRM81007]|uniref:2-C-methyl-D-erythritol 4-phosphate cytidylyltransferase n=1 Tax=Kineococcus sp. TRM81007 TaxID=2925831 RepID=UPI002104C3B1|nr:2-C-methyl-D-erythritol 4-phosphate cytidylyltransferase [Kineococcus sp. TRM81007]